MLRKWSNFARPDRVYTSTKLYNNSERRAISSAILITHVFLERVFVRTRIYCILLMRAETWRELFKYNLV